MLGIRVRSRIVVVTVGVAMAVSLAVASAALADSVPASGQVVAHLVTGPAPSTNSAGPVVAPLRVAHPALYAQEKGAANAAYQDWLARRPFTSMLNVSTPSASVTLNSPGMDASISDETPPDTTGAISPGYYFEWVNSAVQVYSRSTLAAVSGGSATEDSFTGSSGTCDGQIKWDQAAQRWLYWSLDCSASSSSNGFSFGWSKTANPLPLTGTTANWCKFHAGTGSLLEDYGKLGQDNTFIIIGANEFGSGGYVQSPIFAVPKPAIGSKTCPSSLSIVKFAPSASNEFTPEPANIYGSSASGYIVATNPDGAHLRMYTLTGTTTPALTDDGNITVPAFSVPANVPQPGTTDTIDASDTRLTQAVAAFDPSISAIAVWTQHTIAGPGGGPAVVRWYELNPGQSTPVQTGTINFGSSGLFAFNAAISPTKVGNAAAINYNLGGSSRNVQVRAQVRAATDASGTMPNARTLVNSPGINQDFSCPSISGSSSSCRWGDYAGASPDPSGCGSTVWGTAELNGPTSVGNASWSTQNFAVLADECPMAAFTASETNSATHTESFDGSGSSDSDGSIVKYTWSFGDGSSQVTVGPTTTHSYAASGTYKVTVKVTDSAGLIVGKTASINVS